jgi:hypothetical protein
MVYVYNIDHKHYLIHGRYNGKFSLNTVDVKEAFTERLNAIVENK